MASIVRRGISTSTVTLARQTRAVTRTRLAFGEKRLFTVWKKKRFKRFHQIRNNAVYMPGKNSPLWPMVEQVRRAA